MQEARISQANRSGTGRETTVEPSIRHADGAVSSTLAPSSDNNSNITPASRICGTLVSSTVPSASRVAASIGRAAFLLPPGTSVPWIGRPPRIT